MNSRQVKGIGYVESSTPSPKLDARTSNRSPIFKYYAGFSEEFVSHVIKAANLPAGSTIVDPWAGSGTTGVVANRFGHNFVGIDLNPVMVIVAKARLFSTHSIPSVEPLVNQILSMAATLQTNAQKDDPLSTWFAYPSLCHGRSIENAIQRVLIRQNSSTDKLTSDEINNISDIAALFYVILFKTVRSFLNAFSTSNPTWTRQKIDGYRKLRPNQSAWFQRFRCTAENVVKNLKQQNCNDGTSDGEYKLLVGNSTKLPLKDEFANAIITSPPYCTRLDYAIATSVELVTLGYGSVPEFRELRENLIGTPVITGKRDSAPELWGKTCTELMTNIVNHSSKASTSYYAKTFAQYFSGLQESLQDISRVLKRGGTLAIVAQDSFYKELHVDLPTVIIEMARKVNIIYNSSDTFYVNRTMLSVNSRSAKHFRTVVPSEKALYFTKQIELAS